MRYNSPTAMFNFKIFRAGLPNPLFKGRGEGEKGKREGR